MNSFRLYMLGLLVLFGGYVALEYYRPKPLDWRPTLSNKDKIPYGTYALYDVLPQLLATDAVESVRLPIYNQFFDEDELDTDTTRVTTTTEPTTTDDESSPDTTTARAAPAADSRLARAADSLATVSATDSAAMSHDADSLATVSASRARSTDPGEHLENENEEGDTFTWPRSTYLFVNQTFAATPAETHALLSFVAAGNDVLIATEAFTGVGLRQQRALPDSLGIKLVSPDLREGNLPGAGSVRVQFTNPYLAKAALLLPASAVGGYFEVRAGRPGATLATAGRGHAVLVRLDHGKGHFYLSSTPLAFSNFYVLNSANQAFALAALSYLPAGRPVWWDEYQKQGRVGDQSVLRVLMAHESLRTAYYLLWVTVLLFLFVEARRRQRIIPVLKPLPNTTLLFTRTVASLYQQGSNHSRIAEKKTALFLDYLRSRFQEPTPDLGDEAFRERLSQKSGVARPRIDELVRFINFARTAPTVSDRELLVLSKAIRDFKRESR